jgi:hypothetical protein
VKRLTASLALAAGLAAPLTGCGLGAKQALADRVTGAAKRLDAAGSATGLLAASVALVASDRPLVPGPPKILPGRVEHVPVVLDLAHRSAAVGVKGDDPKTAVLLFRGSDMYQRIAPKTAGVGSPVLSTAASNLDPLVAAYHGLTLGQSAGDPAGASTTTTTTPVKHAALRRASRIPREWIAFDFARIDDEDATKRAGSLAINPTMVLGLVKGVLTGSIERAGTDAGLVRYDVNVNRDKAERRLDEDDRKLLDKIFRANAVTGRTFPGHVWLDGHGRLRRFEVRLRQKLSNVDRADLTMRIDVTSTGGNLRIPRPDPKGTATVESLGELVTAVSRA